MLNASLHKDKDVSTSRPYLKINMSLMASTATFDIANYDAKEFGNIEYEELERLG